MPYNTLIKFNVIGFWNCDKKTNVRTKNIFAAALLFYYQRTKNIQSVIHISVLVSSLHTNLK
jgi:hypothetical protein